MQTAAAIFLAMHGLAHLVGFAGAWRLGEPGRVLHKANIFGGRLMLSETQLRAAGLLWFAGALAFLAVAVLLYTAHPLAFHGILVAAIFSAVLCLGFMPEARIGFVINIALIALMLYNGLQ
jgi:hypothetical protein